MMLGGKTNKGAVETGNAVHGHEKRNGEQGSTRE